eukprot:TRINITY_DN921_c0_g1_i1.p1 TRINITY_DN921_c0_g1~~TRINITY_DN921_c0_g1_i1.p1  ORF type:complete len:419 (-),score=73.41 TRINITY_DN921_c0_g1_i1:70-1326(-)
MLRPNGSSASFLMSQNASLVKPILRGTLKRFTSGRKWVKRVVFLQPHRILMYKSKQISNSKRSVLNIESVKDAIYIGDYKRGRFVFMVETYEKNILFRAHNESEARDWVREISVIISSCRKDAKRNFLRSEGSLLRFKKKERHKTASAVVLRRSDYEASYSVDSFQKLGVIEKNRHQIIYKCEHILTKKKFALKVIKKERIRRKEKWMSDLKILKNLSNEYVLKVSHIFESENKYYLVKDLAEGPDLETLLSERPNPFTEEETCFYAAEILNAMSYLHEEGFCYSPKLKNIKLCPQGHILCTNFSAQGSSSSGDDWKQFGSIIYDMLFGGDEGRSDDSPEFPISEDAYNFINLLTSGELTDPEEMKLHPFFASIIWRKIEKKTMKSPYIPKADNLLLLSHSQYSSTERIDFSGSVNCN